MTKKQRAGKRIGVDDLDKPAAEAIGDQQEPSAINRKESLFSEGAGRGSGAKMDVEDLIRFCWLDPAAAFERLFRIEAFGSGELIPLKLNSVQRVLHRRVEDQLARQGYVRRVVLKPRRSGLSTYVIARYFLASLLRSNQRILLVTNSEETTRTLFNMVRLMESQLPRVFKPSKLYGNKGELQWGTADGGGRNTRYRLATVGGSDVVGDQINYLHLSEVSRWGNGAADYAGALMRTTKVGHGEQIMESTANGVGGYYYNSYWQAAEGNTAWEADFFPWWSFSDYVRPFSSLADKEAFEASLGTLEKYGGEEEVALLGKTYRMEAGGVEEVFSVSLEHLHWRRSCISDVCQGEIDQFHQDYPSSPEEAFLSSSRSVFKRSVLSNWQSFAREGEAYAIERITDHVGDLRFNIVRNEIGPLRIHQPPVFDREYRIGVDVAEGILTGRRDADYSVAVVLDAVTYQEVACLRLRCDPDELAGHLTAIGRFYNGAWLVVERNNHGLVTVRRLSDHYRYPNIYAERVLDERGSRATRKLGFLTTKRTRPQILGFLKECVREEWLQVKSPVILQEMLRFVVDPNGKEAAQEGAHDDTVMALALALHGCQQIPPSSRFAHSQGSHYLAYDATRSRGFSATEDLEVA